MSAEASGFVAPDDDLLSRALARLGDVQHRRAFYERLENPLWIEPLYKRGALAPERGTITGRGLVQPWPQGEYLQRMAPIAPAAVAGVLVGLLNDESSVVRGVILKAAAQMDGESAALLVKGIVRFIRDLGYFDHQDLLALIESLLAADRAKLARLLVRQVYEPRVDTADEEAGTRLRGRELVGLDPYWYARTLPGVAQRLAKADPEFLKSLSHWLKTVQLTREYTKEDPYYDGSDSTRPSIRPHEQNWGHDEVAESLVDVLRDLAREQLLNTTDVQLVAERVLAGGRPIHRRILLDAVAWQVEQEPASWERVKHVAEALLTEPHDFEGSCRHEVIVLAQACLPFVSESVLAEVTSILMTGPTRSDGEVADFLGRWRGPTATTAEDEATDEGQTLDTAAEVRSYRERWRYRQLAAIGEAPLSGELSAELLRLARELGPIEHPEFDSWHGAGWVGPTSPATSEELASLPDDELINLLRTWRAEPEQHFGPSVEGLARSLEDAAAADPSRFVALLSDLAELPISYTRSALRGLERGLESGLAFAWLPVLLVSRQVVSRADEGEDVPDIEEDDRTWAWTKRQIGSLLGNAVREADWTPNELAIVIDILDELVEHPDPPEDRDSGESGMDSLTLSLNTVRPTAVRALLRLMVREAPDDQRRRIETLLDRHAGAQADASLAVAATFGEAFGALISTESTRSWTTSHLSVLLGPVALEGSSEQDLAYWDTVWSIFLTRYIPHRALLEPLRDYFTRAVASLGSDREPTEGWRQQRNQNAVLGDFLVSLVARGSLPQDDPLVEAYFAEAKPALRGDVLGHLGWQLFRAEGLAPEVLSRSQALLDARASVSTDEASELDDFTWWARISGTDPGWWLPLLVKASRSATFDSRGLLGEVIAEPASAHPELALLAFAQLLTLRGDDGWKAYDLLEHAPQILAAVLDAGDEATKQRAQEVINDLGRDGYLDLSDRIAHHRAPKQVD